jgi:hypothetical protein
MDDLRADFEPQAAAERMSGKATDLIPHVAFLGRHLPPAAACLTR